MAEILLILSSTSLGFFYREKEEKEEEEQAEKSVNLMSVECQGSLALRAKERGTSGGKQMFRPDRQQPRIRGTFGMLGGFSLSTSRRPWNVEFAGCEAATER